jgi:hypothetical protein
MTDTSNDILQEIELSSAFVRLRKDNLIHVHYKKNSTLDPHLQVQMREVFSKLSGGKPTGFIFSADEGFSITKEARENWKNIQHNNPIKAYAIIIANLPQRLVANFFLAMYRPTVTAKLFKTEEEGAAWLRSLP